MGLHCALTAQPNYWFGQPRHWGFTTERQETVSP
jgi:hypothetical protein